jgi:hypothetical protein
MIARAEKDGAMRLSVTGAALIGLGMSLAGCVGIDNRGFSNFAEQLGVDPQDAAGRAVEGAVLGATLGAAVGAMFAINPGIGATVGTEAGGALGAVVGMATAEPLPTYTPIAIPAVAVPPAFYDGWPPGYGAPPPGSMAPPPPRRG